MIITLMWLSAAEARSTLVVDCIDGPYTTIQSAIDDADIDDLVLVEPCTYNENVVVNVDGLMLVANDAAGAVSVGPRQPYGGSVVISGSGLTGPCLEIPDTDFAKVVGFQLIDCEVGIRVATGAYNTLMGNTVTESTDMSLESYGHAYLRAYGNTFAHGETSVKLHPYGPGETAFESFVDNRIGMATGIGMLAEGVFHRLLNNVINLSGAEGLYLGGEFNLAMRNSIRMNGGTNLHIPGDALYSLAAGNRLEGELIDLGYASGYVENW